LPLTATGAVFPKPLTKVDFQLLLAIIAPLLIWPWLPAWDSAQFQESTFAAIALFVFIPVLEEVIFRGFLQGWLLKKTWFNKQVAGESRANWLTSLVFALAHLWQHTVMLIPGYFLVSLLLGHFRERYRGVLVPIFLHAYYNLGLLILHA